MPSKLHNNMVSACKRELGNNVLIDSELISLYRKGELLGYVPDLIRDNNLAVECIVIPGYQEEYKSGREVSFPSKLTEISKKYGSLILVFPILESDNIKEIWLISRDMPRMQKSRNP